MSTLLLILAILCPLFSAGALIWPNRRLLEVAVLLLSIMLVLLTVGSKLPG